MSKNTAIVWAICALTCIGISIYYACVSKFTYFGIYFAVGAVVLVVAIISYIRIRKSEKDKGEK